mmetsp:Transcript_10742/g.16006  ORF Transcript_10742/g.16006 Transcript_10742/m.16006 type:complete len:262 (-) Transcript_10742:205-990(-)
MNFEDFRKAHGVDLAFESKHSEEIPKPVLSVLEKYVHNFHYNNTGVFADNVRGLPAKHKLLLPEYASLVYKVRNWWAKERMSQIKSTANACDNAVTRHRQNKILKTLHDSYKAIKSLEKETRLNRTLTTINLHLTMHKNCPWENSNNNNNNDRKLLQGLREDAQVVRHRILMDYKCSDNVLELIRAIVATDNVLTKISKKWTEQKGNNVRIAGLELASQVESAQKALKLIAEAAGEMETMSLTDAKRYMFAIANTFKGREA